jgi:tetratricopeptide (TPR) repeat protein
MAQLIDPETEQAVWAESYERGFGDVLVLQGEVAQAIAGELEVALTPEETKRLAGSRPVNPEAHDAYLKGSFYWKTLTPEVLDTAQRYFELALEKDPSYAPAYAGLAWVWADRQQMGITPPHEAGPKGRVAALRAIALDDSSAEAHGALGAIRTWTDWDWVGAEQAWRRALELDPNAANTHAYFAHFLAIMGRTDEAIAHSERAIELDPYNALFHGLYAAVLGGARRTDEALAAARAALAIQPSLPAEFLLRPLHAKGMRDEHLALQRDLMAGDSELVAAFEQGLAEAGYEGAMLSSADLLAERWEESGRVAGLVVKGPYNIGSLYLRAGDYDRTIDWLERAYENRSPGMPYVGVSPEYDPLRSDPRFQDLLRRMNLPQAEVGS